LEEAEHAPVVGLELVEVVIDLGRDPPDRAAVAPGQEVLRLGVLEERILVAVEELAALELQRGNPERLVTIEPPRKLEKRGRLAPRGDWSHFERHCDRGPYMPTSVDVFAKARTH